MIYTPIHLQALAYEAVEALLAKKYVTMTHPADWSRDGFPVPVERKPAAADGTVTQDYRPLALLEFAHGCLAGTIQGQKP